MLLSLFINTLTTALVSCTFGFNSNDNPGKVRLVDVNVLTLTDGSYTTGRRSSPVPQVSCVSGSACSHSHLRPKTVQCRNQGSDGYDVQWKCEADLDSSVRFVRTDVTCEGYDYPDDPYVLRGSCGLEYGLEFTHGGSSHSNYYSSHSTSKKDNIPSALSSFISMIGCVGLVLFILWMCSNYPTARNGNASNPGGNHWGGGGPGSGGGGGGGDGGLGWQSPGGTQPPPPPYSDPFNDNGPSCGSNNGCGSNAYSQRGTRGANAGNLGGFWGGLATGGLLGYMFSGNRNRPYSGYNNNQRYNNPFGGTGSSWGGSSGSSGGAGFSGGTRTASGFGGTRRR